MSAELLEQFDSHAELRNMLRFIATLKDEWGGIPMPLGDDNPLVLEPRFPRAKELIAIGRARAEPEDVVDRTKLRNRFYSTHRRCWICVWNEGDRIEWGLHRAVHGLDHQLSTMGASVAWGIEQEANALQLLATMVRHHQYKMYLLSGMFIESSERSGMNYLFRKLRPTVAIRHGDDDRLHIRACLCMHPIGYYDGSWAGVMCPTDDVIAHLTLMRGDEHRFWKVCNQHPPHLPEAGL